PRTMAGSPALGHGGLLPTGCTSTQAQKNMMEARFLDRNMKNPQEGQRLELECLHYERNRPVFWIRLDKSENLHFIAYSTHSYSTTLQEGEKTSPNFVALWRGNSYRLVVKSFRAQDEGIYYCINYINPVLHFSSGQPEALLLYLSVFPYFFFPVATTAAPTTPAATTPSSQATKKDNSQQGLDNALHFCYDVVIWVNLAGACLLLLTAITITITHCQSKGYACLQREVSFRY
uniref:Ig-like domain-containing protein n=1 Tax=Gallus gallus TaxID=9031 RepID=A0A8V0YTA4_CHICK